VDSGLVQAITVLRDVPGVAMVHFDQADVIRHPLVGRIVQAYELHARTAASDPSRSNSHGHRR
jgi:phosphate starvation-inducible PhoH-like protein